MTALLASGAVQAQTPSCEQFKAKLTARLARGSGPFHIVSVPAGETVPAGGRVVGNCGGGTWTLVSLPGVAAPPKPAPAPVREAPESPPPMQTVAPPAVVPVDTPPTVAVAAEMPPAVASAPMPVEAAAAPASTTPSAWKPPAFELLMGVAGVVGLVVVVVAGRRIAYRLRYDSAGLPRGPRLR